MRLPKPFQVLKRLSNLRWHKMITVKDLCDQERMMPVANFALKTFCHDLRERKQYWQPVSQKELAEFDRIIASVEVLI